MMYQFIVNISHYRITHGAVSVGDRSNEGEGVEVGHHLLNVVNLLPV
jgi:hypothetical protein